MPASAVILNVDDNEAQRYVRQRILLDAGFMAHTAGTGQGALDMVALYHPDLILLDINLPDIDGIEVCRRLKAIPENASPLILQISASATTAPHATEALNNGADAYLAEPVDSTVLVATIKALLRLRHAERQLQEANAALHQANVTLAVVNADLRASNQDLQQFAYFASHDLQEPLRQVTNFVQLISESAVQRLTEEEQKFITFVVEGAERMEHLIHALLAYSQLGHGGSIASADVNLNMVIERVMTNLRERIIESGAVISVSPLPTVIGDSVQLEDVFQNLIVNAIKYRSPERSLKIEIGVAEEGPNQVAITVCDNGQGIDPAYHELVFLPFKRLHGREIPGTGIGLAICRRIIEAHDGRITIRPTAGNGTNFYLSLRTPGGTSSVMS